MSKEKKEKEKKPLPNVAISFKTNNGDVGSFNPWNPDALCYLGVGALVPSTWSYHVRGDLYLVPNIARKGHECGGSVNVQGTDIKCGDGIEFSHIFYIDTKSHGKKPHHWNHELWTRKGNGEWTQFDKGKTEFHTIPISDWIEIKVEDCNGRVESKKVFKNYKVEYGVE